VDPLVERSAGLDDRGGLALCAIAVLVALLRGAEGRTRSRIIRAFGIAGVAAAILLVLAGLGGFTHAVTA
jgi:hypothetical protein